MTGDQDPPGNVGQAAPPLSARSRAKPVVAATVAQARFTERALSTGVAVSAGAGASSVVALASVESGESSACPVSVAMST